MRTSLAFLLAAVLAFGWAPPAAAQDAAFEGLERLDGDAFAAAFGRICLDGLPDFAGVGATLDSEGFGAPDAVGTRVHGERAFAVMALTPAETPPGAAPICMVMAPDVSFEAAEALVGERLEARFGPLESARSDLLDVPHRVWARDGEEGPRQFVLTRDGSGHLGIVVVLAPAEDAS